MRCAEDNNMKEKIKKQAFTYIEVIIAMVLLCFLYVVTTKVIQHNLEAKVPVYVYNLYKNLNNGVVLLNKEIITTANEQQSGTDPSDPSNPNPGGGNNIKSVEDALRKMDSKKYCEVFAKDVNTVGKIDCDKSAAEKPLYKEDFRVEYDCTRDYQFSVNSNGEYSEAFIPLLTSNFVKCIENTGYAETVYCNATPTLSISNLLISNTGREYPYTCNRTSSNLDQDRQPYDIDEKPDLDSSIITSNNIRLNFITLESDKVQANYNLHANINQDDICPAITFGQSDYSCSLQKYKSSAIYGQKKGESSFDTTKTLASLGLMSVVDDNIYGTVKSGNNTCQLKNTLNTASIFVKWMNEVGQWTDSRTLFTSGLSALPITTSLKLPTLSASATCNDYLTYVGKIRELSAQSAQSAATVSAPLPTSQIHVSRLKNVYSNVKYYYYGKVTITPKLNRFNEYYTKWNNFFTNNTQFAKETLSAVNISEQGEGVINGEPSNNNQSYLAHFIYATIDAPLSEGVIGENVFAFEHFGSKIIPVGKLANDPNTPLKFNIITRNPSTKKIEKVNNKPLTFCEAMQYTGEKFSDFCGCKNAANEAVTQYTPIPESKCNNQFGCKIQPISPSTSSPKLKLF